MNQLLDYIQQEGVLVLDGAMGTQLFSRGLVSGGSPEEWNIDHPERVQDVHRAYVEAGSQVILTNSFGGTRYRLKLHNLQDRVVELNRAAAQNGRAVADAADHRVLVAGSKSVLVTKFASISARMRATVSLSSSARSVGTR